MSFRKNNCLNSHAHYPIPGFSLLWILGCSELFVLGSRAFFSLSWKRKFALLVSAFVRACFWWEFLRAAGHRAGESQRRVRLLLLHSLGMRLWLGLERPWDKDVRAHNSSALGWHKAPGGEERREKGKGRKPPRDALRSRLPQRPPGLIPVGSLGRLCSTGLRDVLPNGCGATSSCQTQVPSGCDQGHNSSTFLARLR